MTGDGSPGSPPNGSSGMVHAYAAKRTARREERARWDEMVGFHGRVRRGWRELSAVAEGLGPLGLEAAAAEAARLLDEDGVTYRPLGAAEEQTWGLDPLPVFLDEAEWAVLEPGLIQRSQLLEALLHDLYGPRLALRSGALPNEVVHAHPGFLRVWDGIGSTRQLFLAAADLARGQDGAWCVIADRVQAPSGAGYAMANRRVVSRVLPALHRQSEIHRLGPFFHAMRIGLEQIAPPTAEAPRAVLLTPGTQSETAFEQAYLSTLLGYPLVRGSDLVVSDGRVWQQTLGRLEQVDVILRRVDSWYCDPLDLRPDSGLGVPGLVEAARAGSVAVVNGLGSGVLENPGLLPFLPGLCQLLLDEPLRLRSVPTWWCGDPAGLAQVKSSLPTMVVKPLARGIGRTHVYGWELSQTQREDLLAQIEAEPYAWVGQEALACSTAPSILADDLFPQDLTLRTFAVATGAGYQVMTGALGQVRTHHGGLTERQAPPTSKDIWIRNTRGAPTVEPWVRESTPSQVLPLTTSPRVTEDMFWLGRYAERAEDTARLLRSVNDRWADFHNSPEYTGAAALAVLLRTLTEVTATGPGFAGVDADTWFAVRAGELLELILDERRSGTLAFAVRRLTEVSGDVREQLSTDTWLVLGGLERELDGLRNKLHGRNVLTPDVPTAIARVLEGLLALSGLIAESLIRDAGWRFCEIGRRVERALHVTTLLEATVTREGPAQTDSLVFESVLIATESIITYRRRYPARAGVATVLDLLLTDRENPRAVAYQLDRLGDALDRIPAESERITPVREALAEVRASIREADTTTLARVGADGTRAELRTLLAGLSTRLSGLALDVERIFFVQPAPQRSLNVTTSQWEAW